MPNASFSFSYCGTPNHWDITTGLGRGRLKIRGTTDSVTVTDERPNKFAEPVRHFRSIQAAMAWAIDELMHTESVR